jgi:hypothetical protein
MPNDGMELELECIAIEKDEGTRAILGHAGSSGRHLHPLQ